MADTTLYKQIVLEWGQDTDSLIWGMGYSPDNGEHFYVLNTTYGRKYRTEDGDRIWPFIVDKVKAVLDWSNITNKPDLALKTDLTWSNVTGKPDVALKSDVAAVSAVASNAISTANQAKSTADSVDSKVTAIQANGGGRNLAIGTASKKCDTPRWGADGGQVSLDTWKSLRGQWVTISCDMNWTGFTRNTKKINRIGYEVGLVYSDGSRQYIGNWYFPTDSDVNKNFRFSRSWKLDDKELTSIDEGRLYNQIDATTCVTSNLMIEEGVVAHDWSPALEDIQYEIDANKTAAANAQNTANSALSKANSNATALNNKLSPDGQFLFNNNDGDNMWALIKPKIGTIKGDKGDAGKDGQTWQPYIADDKHWHIRLINNVDMPAIVGVITQGNANDLTMDDSYRIDGTVTNVPSTSGLLTIRANSNEVWQTYIDSATADCYTRTRHNGTWTAWRLTTQWS